MVMRALISVSDKNGLSDFAKGLTDLGIEIISTGGTATHLQAQSIPVTEVSFYTGFPEMMEGRLKTLHPKIHGGILGRRGQDETAMAQYDIPPIDLVVVNLYPFAHVVEKPETTFSHAIENIDIGGPTLIRAAAKNHADVAVVVAPKDYTWVLDALKSGGLALEQRQQLAAKAFHHTAIYDSAISCYLQHHLDTQEKDRSVPPANLALGLQLIQPLRYGENPHQNAGLYRPLGIPPYGFSSARMIQGKSLSYNNIADGDLAWECVQSFPEMPACVIVKHQTPCGVAQSDTLQQAYHLAYQADPTAAFGGIIAFNRPLDAVTAKTILDRQFVEVILAPSVMAEAEETLASKPNVRVLIMGEQGYQHDGWDYRMVSGGVLAQQHDLEMITDKDLQSVTHRYPTAQEMKDLLFAWRVVKYVKSNAIVYCRRGQTLGIGGGLTSRVAAAKLAITRAEEEGLDLRGAVMASDAFFPFSDGIDVAHSVGICAVIQPGGSQRDSEVIEAARSYDMAMLLTGMRHFRH